MNWKVGDRFIDIGFHNHVGEVVHIFPDGRLQVLWCAAGEKFDGGFGERSAHDHELIPEETWNSPLYKALR